MPLLNLVCTLPTTNVNYSEGSTLSQKDEVSYWGKIYKVDEVEDDDIFFPLLNSFPLSHSFCMDIVCIGI